MQTYDKTLRLETINAILRGLMQSPEIENSESRDYRRAHQLLAEIKRRKGTNKRQQLHDKKITL